MTGHDPDRLADVWADRDFPVLREVVRLIDSRPVGGVRAQQVQDALPNLKPADIQRAGVNLARAGLVDISGASGQRVIWFTNVSERALRLAGLWPDEEAAADQLLWVLEQKVVNATTPDERGKWTKIRDAVVGGGRDLAIELTGAVLARQMGV